MKKTSAKTKKVTKRKNKPGAGRPSKLTPKISAKLQAAFAYGFTVEQACIYAEISIDSFYRWTEKNKKFSEDMTKAREKPTMKAKQVVIDSIQNGDTTDAKWWLERKSRSEFGKQNTPSVVMNFNQVAKEERDEFRVIDAI